MGCSFRLSSCFVEIDSIQEKEDRKKGIQYDWFYIIEPFASLENFFGNDQFYNEFVLTV